VVLHLPNDVLHLLYTFSVMLIKGKNVVLNHESLKGGFHREGLMIFTLKWSVIFIIIGLKLYLKPLRR
jgi:hypothetical protein